MVTGSISLLLLGASARERPCPGGQPYTGPNVAALCAGHFPSDSEIDHPRWVVFFYGRECRRCAELAPTIAAAAEMAPPVDRGRRVGTRKSRPALLFGAVDCHHVRNQRLCKTHGIWKLPVLRALARGGVNFGESFDARRIYEWAAAQSGAERPLPPSIRGQPPRCPAHELYDEPKLAAAFLRAHNVYRCIAGLKMLTWDVDAWKSARKWARKAPVDQLRHSPEAQRMGPGGVVYGENIAISHLGALQPGQVAARWYAEIRSTDEGRIAGKLRGGVGHYTQLVWRGTRRVGCAIEQGGRVAVCQYFPPGNTRGKYLTQVAPPLATYGGIRGEERCGGPVEDVIV